ncbi:unnamed protein product [Sympodiomycopsis kandeliae]
MASQSQGKSRIKQVFVGSIVTPLSPLELRQIQNGLLGVDDKGVIAFVEDLDVWSENEGGEGTATPVARPQSGISSSISHKLHTILRIHGWTVGDFQLNVLRYGQFLCPGFIDTHTHACQIPNIGVGQEYELLDWLNNVTFPREKRFGDLKYAEKTYNSVVQRLIDSGTTTACYYATLHLEASKILARVCTQRGQRAFVGKCNMDRNSPDDYREESVATSIRDTEIFLSYCQGLHEEQSSIVESCGQQIPPMSSEARSHSSSISSTTSSDVSPPDLSSSSSETSLSSVSTSDGVLPVTQLSYGAVQPSPHKDDEEDKELMDQSLRKLSFAVDEMIEASDLKVAPLCASPGNKIAVPERAVRTAKNLQSLDQAGALVQPILTPRFAISCTDALLEQLSVIYAREPGIRLQTHLSESTGEIEFTRELFPFAPNYTKVYDHFKLLTDRTVLAHCVHLSNEELDLIKLRGSGISHCPTSNLNLRSGVTKVGEMLNCGVKVGLGTDVSGGFGIGMLNAVREASVVAKVLNFTQKEIEQVRRESMGSNYVEPVKFKPSFEAESVDAVVVVESEDEDQDALIEAKTRRSSYDFTARPLSIPTLFYLATLGGAHVASVADSTGSLEVGKDFDALCVSLCDSAGHDRQDVSPTPMASPCASLDGLLNAYTGNPNVFVHTKEEFEEDEKLAALVEKFLFTADDRNIHNVWVRGRLIGGTELRKERSALHESH